LQKLKSKIFNDSVVMAVLECSRYVQNLVIRHKEPISQIRAGPSRCGASGKTEARGTSEQWFYDVIVFGQPCYDRCRAQMCSTAL